MSAGDRIPNERAYTQEDLAEAWAEGHSVGRMDPYCLDRNPYMKEGVGDE